MSKKTFGAVKREAGKLIHDRSGVGVVMLAIVLPVLIMSFSIAVDSLQALVFRQKLQTAVDATTLAVAKRSALDAGLSAEDLETFGLEFLASQFQHRYTVDDFDIDTGEASAHIQATGNVTGLFTKIFGVDTLDYVVNATAQYARKKIEIALALDNSRSINDSELAALRQAAKSLIDEVLPASSSADNTQTSISVVPFAGMVRLPASETGNWWIDLYDGSAPNHFDHISTTNYLDAFGTARSWRPTRGELFDQIDDRQWGGCVEHRIRPLDIQDDPPVRSDPDTWFLPYFSFDVPDSFNSKPVEQKDSAANNYLDDDVGSCSPVPSSNNFMANVDSTCKYGEPGSTVSTNGGYADLNGDRLVRGPNFHCTVAAMQPLTNDRTALWRTLDDMTNDNVNVTDITAGLMWSWRALSPGAPLEQSTTHAAEDSLKFIVLMSDGANAGRPAETRSYGGWGYPGDGRLSSSLDHDSKAAEIGAEMDQRTADACDNVKADGITIVAVNFGQNPDGTALLGKCASDPKLFFEPTDTEGLHSVFRSVGQTISALRLTR